MNRSYIKWTKKKVLKYLPKNSFKDFTTFPGLYDHTNPVYVKLQIHHYTVCNSFVFKIVNTSINNAAFKSLEWLQCTFRVWPQEVTHGPIMGHLLFSVNGPDLVQSLDGGRQAAVHTEDLRRREEFNQIRWWSGYCITSVYEKSLKQILTHVTLTLYVCH